jgi:hypothetical protein
MATPDRFDAADRRWQSLVPGLIIATDTAFSSNRFALAHQIHKLDLQVELKETVVSQSHATQLLKSSHLVMPAPVDVGARVARAAFPDNRGARS